MTRLTQIAHLLTLLAIIVFLAVIGYRVNRVLAGMSVATNQLNVALRKVNQPKTGTLAEIDKTVLAAKSTLVHIDTAAEHEDHNLGTLDRQEAILFAKTGGALDSFTGTANAATQSLHGASLMFSTANDSIAAFKPLLEASTRTVDDADRFINQPALTATVENFRVTSGNLAATSTDFQTKFHAFLFPPPCKTKRCKIARLWPYIHGGAEMAEPAYWGWQLAEGAKP
jgi:hypothetical protein